MSAQWAALHTEQLHTSNLSSLQLSLLMWHLLLFIALSRIHFRPWFWNNVLKSVSCSWFRQETPTRALKSLPTNFQQPKLRPDFCFASIWIAKFQWLTSRPGSLFPGETEERSFSLLMSVDQTTWRSAGRWGLCRSHILLSSKSYKLFIWSGKTAAKRNTHWQVPWLNYFSIIPSWRRN